MVLTEQPKYEAGMIRISFIVRPRDIIISHPLITDLFPCIDEQYKHNLTDVVPFGTISTHNVTDSYIIAHTLEDTLAPDG